jgi:hypothetical protein
MPPPHQHRSLLLARDEHNTPVETHTSSGLPGWAIFLIVLVVIALIAAAAFAVYKLILNPHSPRSRRRNDLGGIGSGPGNLGAGLGGIGDSARSWMSNVVYKVKNPRARSTTAGYEPSGISAGRARGGTGHSALDPDEAWDARVGHEAEYGNPFYEETELQSQGMARSTRVLGTEAVRRRIMERRAVRGAAIWARSRRSGAGVRPRSGEVCRGRIRSAMKRLRV